MIIAKIVQKGQIITLEDVVTTFQYSANLKMQFVIDESYKDCIITGWYRKFWKKEEKNLLDMQEDGTFLLGQDVFENDGTVEFSFALNYQDGKIIVHLGVVEYYVKKSFGNGDAILPEETETWISVVSRVVKDQMSDNWDKDYKPQLEENLNIIEDKTSEIISAAEKVKQDALESSTNARNALESANLAKNSADSAKEAEEKALEHMSNAEKFKNSASSFAEQADLAKNSALESATNASNSASNALDNANKAKEHLDSVNTAVNNFNTDYAQKINEFNTNYATKKEAFDTAVNNANTALNATITEANTSINSKVAEASAQANIAKQEADRATLATDGKLDKNQGTDNAGKAMVVDEEGNIIPGEAGINNDEVNALIDSAIKEKLYTQEEVDYLLRDKMDKPYADITITEDTTIDCTMDGNLKIDTIEGKSVQNVEENIVPTVARPISIVSKKVLVDGEYTELRSLKESVNLIDEKLCTAGYIVNGTGAVSIPTTANEITSDFISLSGATSLTYRVEGTTIADKPQSGDEKLWLGVGYYDAEKNFISRFTATSIGVGKRVLAGVTSCPSNTYYFRFSFRTYEDVKATVVLGNKTIDSYIPQTVRDYKIVDHASKTAKIVRNIGVANLTNLTWTYGDRDLNHIRCYAISPMPLKVVDQYCYCNVFECIYSNKYDYSKEAIYLGNNIGDKTISIMANQDVFAGQTQEQFDRLLKEYINNPNAVVYYALETPTEETIAYSADDVSEVGYSWQDTTSPSPTIPAEIKGVDKIDVTVTGKNLVNGYDNFTILKSGTYCLSTNKSNVKTRLDFGLYDENKKLIRENIVSFVGSQFYLQPNGTYRLSNDANAIKSKITFDDERVKFIKIIYIDIYVKFDEIQLEVGDTATAYEPYTEQRVNITLPQPLYQNDIANVESGNYDYYLKQKTGNTLNNISVQLVKSKTALIVIPKVSNGFPQTKFSCDCNMFESKVGSISGQEDDEEFINSESSMYSIYINVKKDRLTTYDTAGAVEFITNSNMIISYPDTTPTTQPIPPEDLAKSKSLKTNAGVNNIFVGGEIKPSIEARYPQDVVLAVNRLQTKLLTLQKEVIKNV